MSDATLAIKKSRINNGAPTTPFEVECSLGGLLLAAERLPEHETRILLTRVLHDAAAQHEVLPRIFLLSYADLLKKRLGHFDDEPTTGDSP